MHNREESVNRKFTKLLNKNGIIAARDKEQNGIWMGLSEKNKHILMMTNNRYKFRINHDVEYTSRGLLNEDLVSGKYNDQLQNQQNKNTIKLNGYFHGFNIFLCQTIPNINCYFISNRVQSTCHEMESKTDTNTELPHNEARFCKLSDGIHIISNGQLNNDIIWARVRNLRKRLETWIDGINTQNHDVAEEKKDQDINKTVSLSLDRIVKDLREIMGDDTFFDETELPTIKQCEFSYCDPKWEQTAHKAIFCKPYFRGENTTDATVSQGMVVLERKENENKYYYFHRKGYLDKDLKKNEDEIQKECVNENKSENDSIEWQSMCVVKKIKADNQQLGISSDSVVMIDSLINNFV